MAGTTAIAVAVAVMALLGIRGHPAPGGLPGVGVVALSWLLVPFAGLIAMSILVEPSYHPRYLLYCVPAVALLAGTGLDRLAGLAERFGPPGSAWVVSLAGLGAFVILVWPIQLAIREPDSRPDDLRALAAVLGDQSRHGDSVLYLPANRRVFMTVYADGFAGLDQTKLHRPGATRYSSRTCRRPTSSQRSEPRPASGLCGRRRPTPVMPARYRWQTATRCALILGSPRPLAGASDIPG